MFEKDLPGQNTAGFNAESEIGNLPLETCDTINRAWGYNATDKRYKSVKELVHYLVRAAGHGANFLLNVGPMPSGEIQPEFVERLKGIGQWTAKQGPSIYGTKAGPVSPRAWGATTQSADKVFVHVLDWSDELLALPDLGNVRNAKIHGSGQAVTMSRMEGGVVLRLPQAMRDPIDTIVVLEKARG
jgi:alpha-L-fucosidase